MSTNPSSASAGMPSASRRRVGARLSGLATVAALGLMGWLGYVETATLAEQRGADRLTMRATELRDGITRLDELLTVLAQGAVQTGNKTWAERYDQASSQMEDAIAQAVALASPSAREALATTTGEGHRDLVMMERRAITLAGAGEREAAQALLDGPDFDYLKSVYTSGLEMFGDDLKAQAAAQAEALNGRIRMQTIGLGLTAVLLAGGALVAWTRGRLRRALARVEAVSLTDALTDLPNRRRLREMLVERLADGDAVLLILGLDRFKDVNGTHGQAAGDRLLQLAAARLGTALRPGEVMARLGGDEFAVVGSAGASAPGDRSAVAAQFGKRFTAALEAAFEPTPGIVIQLSGSIGVVLAEAGQDADEALQRGATALDAAKAGARGGLRVFEPGMDAQLRARATLEAELRQAVMDDAVVPHFQPLVDLATGRVVGVEMLARWPHPQRGMVPPVTFIPLAEETGLIAPMTERLMRRACRVAAGWPETMVLACNISPLQLRDRDFPATIRAILDETGLPPHRLELEVTESALVGDIALARTLLDQLRSLEVRLALDDFGTGYSSLRHLQKLPFDKLKVDASFVGAMASDAESAKIVSAIVALGHSLGLVTVGEGIETAAMAASLRALGCDVGQGWFYGRPGPAESIDALLAERACTEADDRLLTT